LEVIIFCDQNGPVIEDAVNMDISVYSAVIVDSKNAVNFSSKKLQNMLYCSKNIFCDLNGPVNIEDAVIVNVNNAEKFSSLKKSSKCHKICLSEVKKNMAKVVQ
jgi:hypothetical protein